jgi:hypothetical protein
VAAERGVNQLFFKRQVVPKQHAERQADLHQITVPGRMTFSRESTKPAGQRFDLSVLFPQFLHAGTTIPPRQAEPVGQSRSSTEKHLEMD